MSKLNYLNNPNLKNSRVTLDFTEDQVKEYVKCAGDVEYFTRNYVKIVNVDRGLIPFDMWDFQAKMINTFAKERFTICKLSRQCGKTTTSISYILWLVLFHDSQNVAILANKGSLARDILAKLQLAYEHLPSWLQQGVEVWNKGNIELENGSKVIAASTSSSAVRGGSYNLIFLDEFGHVPRNIAENFFSSVYPTISSGTTTQVIIVSTPYGMNHFYKMWTDAVEKRSFYVPIEIHWSDVPGRDQKWKDETIRNTSEEQFRQEFETLFLGSTATLIHPTKLRELAFTTPILKDEHGTDFYHLVEKDHQYAIVFDVSEGVGGDYSAFTVFDITSLPYVVVAKYRNKEIAPILLPELLSHYGRYYNHAGILGENNGIGIQVVDALYTEMEYEHVIATFVKNKLIKIGGGFAARSQFGVRTTKQVKKIGCANLKSIIESNQLIITDFEIIEELSTFTEQNNSYKADDGYHDDLVMTLVLFAWFTTQRYFKEMTNNDIRHKLTEEMLANINSSLLPVGFLDDGTTDDGIAL